MLVAEGALDAAVDAELALWDYAALEPIVLEAGGRLGDGSRGAVRLDERRCCTTTVLAALSA